MKKLKTKGEGREGGRETLKERRRRISEKK